MNNRKIIEQGGSGLSLYASSDGMEGDYANRGLMRNLRNKALKDNINTLEGNDQDKLEQDLLSRQAGYMKEIEDLLIAQSKALAGVEGNDSESKSTGLGSRPTDASPSAEAAEVQETTGELPTGANALLRDDEFMSQLALMQDKYPGLTQQEIFDVIQGESSFRLDVVNSGGYKGLFQIGEKAAKEAGIDYTNLEKMSAADQLRAYDKYLQRWGYDGTYSLGILQAAPSKRNASPETVVYTKKGNPDVFRLNPKWFDANGNATVASINKYYGY